MPSDFELNERLSHSAPIERLGRRVARVCRTRASASLVRSVASATTGASPAARRTASANDSRRGAGVWASALVTDTIDPASIRRSGRITSVLFAVLRDAAKENVEVTVDVLVDVKVFARAKRERMAPAGGVHERRHGQLDRNL